MEIPYVEIKRCCFCNKWIEYTSSLFIYKRRHFHKKCLNHLFLIMDLDIDLCLSR